MIEKNELLPLVEGFIKNNCQPLPEEPNKLLKSFIKKDENKCFSIFDRDHSIKCIFDKNFLENYLSEQPSHIKFETFENSLILIKKYYLDLLVVKNLNKTVSLRCILYIQDFEIDVAQKSKDKNIKKNINTHPNVKKLLQDFYLNFTKDCLEKHSKYLDLKAENFIKNEFPVITKEEHYSSKNKSLFKIIEEGKNNFLLNTQINVDDETLALESYAFKESHGVLQTDINIEELLKIDYKKIFNKQPSQVLIGRKEGDFTLTNELIKNLPKESQEQSETKLLNRKTHRPDIEIEEKRSLLLNEMPDSIKDLITKYKEKKFTIDIYEKYKIYKSNASFIKQML